MARRTKAPTKRKTVKWRDYKKTITFFFVPLWIMMGVLEVGERYFTGVVVQEALNRTSTLRTYLFVMAALFLVIYLLSHFSRYLLNRVVEPAIMGIRENLLTRTMYTEYANVEKLKRGEMLTKLTQNLGTVQAYEEQVFPEFVRGVTKGLLALAVCVWISPLLSLILFLSVPLIILINVFTSIPAKSLVEKRNTLENRQNTYAQNRLDNICSVKVYALEGSSEEEYGEVLGKLHEQNVKIANLKAVLTLLDGLNYILPYVLIFGGATLLAINGRINVGQIVSFTYLMDYITSLLGRLQHYIFETAEKKDANKRIHEILQMEIPPIGNGSTENLPTGNLSTENPPTENLPAENIPTENIPIENSRTEREEKNTDGDGEISFRHVTFAYSGEEEKPILRDVNLRIRRGEKVAVTGESGSGKSTLLKLISGLYQVTGGELDVGSTRVAYVNQENFLLEASVADNIRGQNAFLSDASLREAARRAGISDFVERLPDQYDTMIGMAGKLSGGEMQRLCLARAYAQDAEILLLDEPTSALDREKEGLVWDQVKGSDGKTIVMVTHTLLDAAVFDRIYRVENGTVQETDGGNGGEAI